MREKLIKLKDGLRGNQGFTLVELLTSLMIFAFFAAALLQYMITASSIHSTVNSNVDLEIKALATLGTIEEYAIDASASVIFDDTVSGEKTLYIINNDSYEGTGTGCKVYGFRFIEDSGVLQYMTTSQNVYKTSTTVNKTYHERSKGAGATAIKEVYLKIETITYTNNPSLSNAHATATVVEKYATMDDAKDRDSGSTVTSGVPVLEDEWIEVKSYESDSSVVFTNFELADGSAEVLTSEMTAFEANFIKNEGKILQIDLTFGMANYKDSYDKVASIMLRNTPPSGKISTT